VLFLAPSTQLVSQTLREWTAQSTLDLQPVVVCSDAKASRITEDISVHDMVLPATTDPQVLHERLQLGRRGTGLKVVFSTDQSIDVVSEVQQLGAEEFDLILCDEAHRTTSPACLRLRIGFALLSTEELVPSAVRDVAELRDVDMDQGSRLVVLVASDRFTGDPINAAEPVDPATHEDGMNRRRRDAELTADLDRPQPTTPPRLHDPFHHRGRRLRRHRVWPTGTIKHPRGPFGPKPRRPLARRRRRGHEHLRRDG